jgi:cysteine desulfurase family protein (TIGR01976 family)
MNHKQPLDNSNQPLDLDFVRGHFPALAGDWIFFDNAGGSQVLESVVERVADYLRTTPVQLGATYAVSERAAERQREAARALAEFINAADASECVLGPSTTALLGRLARALGPSLAAGDEIIVTNVDHEANIGCWRRLAARGIRIKTWPIDRDTLRLEPETLKTLLNERTRLVCFTQTSNILGSIEPVAEIARLAHQYGAKVCVDAVACAPHHSIDVRALDVDYYVFSLYKVYGPHLALLYGKRDLLLDLDNLNHAFIGAQALPLKLQPGAVSYELVHGAGAIPDYFLALSEHAGGASAGNFQTRTAAGYTAIQRHEQQLAGRLLDFLSAKPGVRIIGSQRADRNRTPTISFVKAGIDSATIPPAADARNIGIRYGHFYAKRLIDDLGLAAQHGVVRVSMAHYNTLAEVDRLVGCLDPLL